MELTPTSKVTLIQALLHVFRSPGDIFLGDFGIFCLFFSCALAPFIFSRWYMSHHQRWEGHVPMSQCKCKWTSVWDTNLRFGWNPDSSLLPEFLSVYWKKPRKMKKNETAGLDDWMIELQLEFGIILSFSHILWMEWFCSELENPSWHVQ